MKAAPGPFKLIKLILLNIMPVFFFSAACGQLQFDHLSVSNGLSQSTVLAICKDSRGYMWFGTRDRLNRYDGRNIISYKSDVNDHTTISSEDYIYAVSEDKSKNLWIGTQNGLNRYIPEKDAFERIVHDPENANSICNNIVLSIFPDSKGRVWFATNYGLSMLEDAASRKFKNFTKTDGLAGNSVYAVFEDQQGQVWVGTTEGLSVLTNTNGKYAIKSYYHVKTNPASIASNSIKAIAQDQQGRIWIGTEADGLDLFNPGKNSFTHFKYNPSNKQGISNNLIRRILLRKNGQLWVATMNGLNVLNPNTLQFTVYTHDPDDRKSLSDNSIKEIYEDDLGSVWLGTMFGGVNVTHDNTKPFTVFRYNKYKNSISSNLISVIEADASGNLWIGTEGQGLNYYNVKTGTFKQYVADINNPNSLASNTIKAIFKDSKNNIWIGLYQGGLEHYISSTDNFKHYDYNPNAPNSISYGYVSSIAEDDHGRLLVGTSSKGLNIFDPKTEKFTLINDHPGKGIKLSSNYIRFAYMDTKKSLWVGTPRGLNLLRNGAKQFIVFDKGRGLKSNLMTCIKEDHSGNIWVGTTRGGISKYQAKSNSFITYTTSDGLASNNIIDMLEDNDGNLWISTDRGLTKFEVSKSAFENYNTADGLPANEFNTNSAYKDKNGKLYFGSYDGLVSFIPQNIKRNEVIPRLIFIGLKLFNKQVAIGGSDGLLKKDINFTRKITFSSAQNIFTIDFLALSYIQSQRNKYAYKLEGFEKDWNYVNTPSATYTNLPAGKYTFMVKGSNNDGVWNNAPKTIEIVILPPFWKTWWAYLLYFILFFGSLYFVLRFTLRQQQLKSELHYEHLNHERQQQLYEHKLEFFTRISHEIRTPLTLIFAPLEKLMKLTRENTSVYQQLQGIRKNTDRLLRLVSELLDFRKLDTGNTKLQVSENELIGFCHSIFENYRDPANIKNIKYHFESQVNALYAFYDVNQLEKVFYNILSNAFKYTPVGGTILFSIEELANQVKVVITDTGIGIPADVKEKIFDTFYQVKSPNTNNEGWGIGLALVKGIIDLHGGEIGVDSLLAANGKPGKTSITVLLPLGHAHFNPDVMMNQGVITETVADHSTAAPLLPETSNIISPVEKKYTIQVIEDNNELRGFIIQSLQDSYHILESANGLEGLEKALEQVPDVIVSDVTMPGLNGFELCLKLKAEERTNHIPIILLTAMASHLKQIDGFEAGADAYITKPFSIQVLELNIRNLLKGREYLKEKYLREIMLTPRKLDVDSPDVKFLDKLMSITEKHMENPEFNVSGLVENIGMSQTILYKKIKALTGLSITDFIKMQRLKRAAQLLSESNFNIAEAAWAVGFNDRKYFSKEFRKQFGFAPSDYQKKTKSTPSLN